MLRLISLAAALAGIALTAPVRADGITQKDFETFAEARFGPPDGKPRFWYGTGPVRDAATGETRYTFEYYDTVRHIVDPKNPNRRFGIVRKLDLFRDAKTHEVLQTLNGQPVKSWVFPYQLLELEYKEGAIMLTVTQGSGKFLRTHKFSQVDFARYGEFVHITIPGHFKVTRPELPDSVQAHTMTSEFIVCEGKCKAAPRNQWVQAGVSPMTPWAGGDGKRLSYMFMSGARYESYADLPQTVRSVIDAQYPQWREPAKDLAEVESLQRE